jgi:hypothetical protein
MTCAPLFSSFYILVAGPKTKELGSFDGIWEEEG